ncbi:MAG: alanine--tRNA ligase-related protein [Candidatus ainarchaeum sp.]|nr:alanine--tRNA ligase-related protein [Candidatus ainarchaeum sp.]
MDETKDVKQELLRFCEKKDFNICNSFPVISQEKDLLFLNASITPFKHLFLEEEYSKENIALIQKCIRAGGKAYSFEEINESLYCNTFFEMFGSIFFNSNHQEVIGFLFELLEYIDINKNMFYFIIPFDDIFFEEALLINGIDKKSIFKIKGNNIFWTEWKFGKNSLVGEGITLVYSRKKERVHNAEQLLHKEDAYVPLLNVINIRAKEESGEIREIKNQGFEIAIGIERLLAIKQACNHYEIDSIKDQFRCVKKFFEIKNTDVSITELKVITDHLRTIGVLIGENVTPAKSKQGYVLRKMIRTVVEIAIIMEVDIDDLLIDFYKIDYSKIEMDIIIRIIKEEKIIFKNNIDKISKKISSIKMSEKKIKETYGISSNLLKKVKEIN